MKPADQPKDSTAATHSHHSKIFRPPFRRTTDIVLITDIGLLILYAVTDIPLPLILLIGLVLNALEIGIWTFWLRNLFSVRITEESITGPGTHLQKVSFLRSEFDKEKTEILRPNTKAKGYLDLWALDGKRIRVFRKAFGRRPVHHLCTMLLGDTSTASKQKEGYHL